MNGAFTNRLPGKSLEFSKGPDPRGLGMHAGTYLDTGRGGSMSQMLLFSFPKIISPSRRFGAVWAERREREKLKRNMASAAAGMVCLLASAPSLELPPRRWQAGYD